MAKTRQNVWQQYIAVTIAVIAVIVFGSWYYCSQYYMKPETVFWATMDRNLQTASVTKTVYSANEAQSFSQISKLQFKAQLAIQTSVVVKDETAGTKNIIITDTIGTPTQDYLKYSQITSDAMAVPSEAIGAWALNNASDTQEVQVFATELLSSPVIFGYLNHAQRSELIKLMHDNKAFNIDYSTVNTASRFEGKRFYSYDVAINLPSFVAVYQTYLKMIGQDTLANQIAAPISDTTLAVTMIINPVSRQLRQLTIDESGATVTFSNYDTDRLVELPTDAKLTIAELQNLLLN